MVIKKETNIEITQIEEKEFLFKQMKSLRTLNLKIIEKCIDRIEEEKTISESTLKAISSICELTNTILNCWNCL